MQCDLPVKCSDWLRVLHRELTFGVIAAFLFWPAGFILFPDFLFNFEEQQEVKNGHQIQNPSPNSQKKSNGELSDSFPVDDESPITFATFINKCVEQCPKTSNFCKLFCLCYLVIPIFGYIFFALSYIFLLDFLNEIEDKQAIQENFFFHYIFDIRSKPYVLFPVIIFFVIPGSYIYFVAFKSAEINKLRSELRKNLKELPKQIFSPGGINRKWMPSDANLCGPTKIIDAVLKKLDNFKIFKYLISTILIFIYVLMLVFCAVYGVVLGAILFLILLGRCTYRTIKFSPFIVLLRFIKTVIEIALPRYFFVPFWVGWVCYFSLAVSICCRFYIRMFGFVLMGLIINAQKTTPYVIFFYVLISNISTSYRSFQKRFMDIKKIIFLHYEKQDSLTKNVEDYRKTIPKDLFWYICNEREILPFQQEICVMLISTLI